MGRSSDIAIYLVTALVLLAVAAGLYAGWKLFPFYTANQDFESSIRVQVSLYGGDQNYTETLRDAIYRAAQQSHLPVQREDIQVEDTPLATRVDVNYTVVANLGFGPLPLKFHPQYPKPKQIVTTFDRAILGIIGFLLGLYWFFQGFGIFREYKLIEDTPVIPVRSVAMGLVQIHGKAVGEKTLLSPVSNQPCFLYKVDIERWSAGRQGSGSWGAYLADWGAVGFYLEDETGKVLVDPQGADIDVEQLYQCEVSAHEIVPLDAPWREETPPTRPGLPASDSELRSYVRRVAMGMNTAIFQGADKPLSKDVGRWRRKPRRGFGLSLGTLWGLVPMAGLAETDGGASAGDYRLSEYCVVPEDEYDIIGTCSMNPDSQNDQDRQLICLGQNDRTFLISNQTEKALEEDLRLRAWRHIVGGGLLAVAGAAVLLEIMGLIV